MSQQISRRAILESVLALGASSLVPTMWGSAALAADPPSLDPATLQQFVQDLVNPLDPRTPGVRFPANGAAVTMSINQTEHDVGLLGSNVPLRTKVWGYGVGSNAPVNYPGPTFEVRRGQGLSVTFENDLVQIQHPLPIDETLDWANPGALGGMGPVPVVAHLHGGRSQTTSDGLPDGWFTSANSCSPTSPATCNNQNFYNGRLFSRPYQYQNDQEAGHLWYHDHVRGITRLNVYMGLAGHYFIRDANEKALQDANVLPQYPYEVALVLQDRQFSTDATAGTNGSLLYPAFDPDYANLPVTHLPEFFGDAILVNGRAWPKMTVEQRKYRFRILNGSDSRFYALSVQRSDHAAGTNPQRRRCKRVDRPLPIWVVGNELGLLDTPESAFWFSPADPTIRPRPRPNTPGGGISQPDTLLIGPGERYDIVVDFSAAPVGARLLLWNAAASPYNGQPADGVEYADPTVGLSDRLMAFDVVARQGIANATVSANTKLRRTADTAPLPPPQKTRPVLTRQILLVEGTDKYGRLQTMLGTVGPDAATQGTFNFADPVTEKPVVGTTEIWEFYNTTADAHPIHMHLVDFRIINRQAFTGTISDKTNTDESLGATLSGVKLTGPVQSAEPWQSGKKDTVVAYPGYVTRVIATFTRAGEYVYHCHILSHEDHDMMRRYEVVEKIV